MFNFHNNYFIDEETENWGFLIIFPGMATVIQRQSQNASHICLIPKETIPKLSISQFCCCLLVLLFFLAAEGDMGNLSSATRIESVPLAVEE